VTILDTNVVSELMKPAPSPAVMQWVSAQSSTSVAIPTVAVAEIHYGLERLPAGKRRTQLEQNFELFLQRGFAGRVLAFDDEAARIYGKIVAAREKAGRPVDAFDAMIAAIARSQKAIVATQDIAGFWGCGVKLVNPFV